MPQPKPRVRGVRRLPSGRWQASVYMPGGRRTTFTHPLLSYVEEWSIARRAEYAAGSTRDPRSGQITVAAWYTRWSATRQLVKSTEATDAGRWRKHLEPRWGSWRLADIARSDVAAWVVELQGKGLSAKTVRHCVGLLGGMLKAAWQDDRIPSNPAQLPDRSLPKVPAAKTDFYSPAEINRLLAVLDQPYATLVELMAYTGLRWEEAAGLTVDHVDPDLGLIYVRQVLERDGTLRAYAKSKRSHRAVPIPPHMKGTFTELMDGLDPDELLFRSLRGRPLRYHNVLTRVWLPAVEAAGLRNLGLHALRHTALSWQAMNGVDMHRIQQLAGHEDQRTTARYAHLADDAFAAVLGTWERMGVQ